GRFDRRIITDGFADEPAADSVDRTARELQGRPPGGLERYGPSRLGEGWLETADGRLGARSEEPLDESRETIEPRVEHEDPGELEDAAECRQGQHAIGIIKLSTHPVCDGRDRSEQQYPDDADS